MFFSFFSIAFPMLDPVLISVGPLEIRWYSLAYILGVSGAYFIVKRVVRKRLMTDKILENSQTNPIVPDHIERFTFTYAVIGVILGGRLGYVLFYNLPYFISNPQKIFAVWEGGMSFHGGTLGVLFALLIFTWRHKLSTFSFADVICVGVPLGLLFGRIANFINGELYGRVTDLAWAVRFPAGGYLPRHPSQLYEAFLEGFLLLLLMNFLAYKTNALARPGLLAGIFQVSYGTARFFVEIFREPDAHLGFIFLKLTMGMILSLPMILIGIILIIRALLKEKIKTA